MKTQTHTVDCYGEDYTLQIIDGNHLNIFNPAGDKIELGSDESWGIRKPIMTAISDLKLEAR